MTGNSGGPMTVAKIRSGWSHDRGERHSTHGVPIVFGFFAFDKQKNPNNDRHFRASNGRVARLNTKDRG
jgi:hypothetical protein